MKKASTKPSIFVGCPNLVGKDKFLCMVDKIWESKRLSNDGPYVREFEKQIQQFLNVPHAVAVCNGTAGLEILAKATMEGYEKLFVPAFTFVATVYAMSWIGMKPVFVDIDPETHNIPTVGGMPTLAVHLWGQPCPQIGRETMTPLIYDAAHAFGCAYEGVKVGNFGMGEVFSFHATKFINSLEGGVITTRYEEVAEKCKLLRNFGFADYDKSIVLGINGKMNEIQAAMGLCSLENFNQIVRHNYSNYWIYREKLADIKGLRMIRYMPSTKPNYQYIVVEIEGCRDRVQKALWAENIFARRYFYPGVHKMEPYKHLNLTMPNAEAVSDRVLVLPTGLSITGRQITKICYIIKKEIESYAKEKRLSDVG